MDPKEWTKHLLNVARLARKIAQRAGIDEEKAYISGLLHGRAKNGQFRFKVWIQGNDAT